VKQILILGAGAAGTMMAQHLARAVDGRQWGITVVDQHDSHYYQPGFLFIPFGALNEAQVRRPQAGLLPRGARRVKGRVMEIRPAAKQVELADGSVLPWDLLIIATGCRIDPGEVEGLAGEGWGRDACDFYTLEGARALRRRLAEFRGGRLVVHIAEMPIKCPVAPLEFAFLADDFLRRRGLRQATTIRYVTPLPGAFTKANSSRVLGHLLSDKGIELATDFAVERVDPAARRLHSYDGRAEDYDLLVTVPPNKGDEAIGRSGLGDELNFIPTDPHTLRARAHPEIFVLGDATDLPSSKAGSVAHFQAELLTENILRVIAGREPEPTFDGHANCFIESGRGRAFLIDFNYELEPVEGRFPLAGLGPFPLLRESRLNHLGKLAFRWIYWNLLLKGRHIPLVPARMSRAGKRLPSGAA
jgi:sulfide:quinone oxidoreductase